MDQLHPRKKIKGITVSNHQIKKSEEKVVKPVLVQNIIRSNNPSLSMPMKYVSTTYTQNSKTFGESTSMQTPSNREFNNSYFAIQTKHSNYQIQPNKTVSFPSYAHERDSKSPIINYQNKKSPYLQIQHKRNSINYPQYHPLSASIYKTEPIRNASVQAVYNKEKIIGDYWDPYRYRSITKVQSINKLEPLQFIQNDKKNSANKSIQLGYYKRQSLNNSLTKNDFQRSLQCSYQTNLQFTYNAMPRNMQVITQQKLLNNDYDKNRLKFSKIGPEEQPNYKQINEYKAKKSQSEGLYNSKIPSEAQKIIKQLQEKIQQSRNNEDFKLGEHAYYKHSNNELQHSRSSKYSNKNIEEQYLKTPFSIEKQKNSKQQKLITSLQQSVKQKDEYIYKQNSKIEQLTKALEQYSQKINIKQKQLFTLRTQAGGDRNSIISELRNRISTLQKENSKIIIQLNQQKSLKKSLENQHYPCQRNKLVFEEQLELIKKQSLEKQRQISIITNQLEMKIHKLSEQLINQKQLRYSLQNSIEMNKEEQSFQDRSVENYKEVICKLVSQKDQLISRLEESKHGDKQHFQITNNQDVSLQLQNKSLKQQNQFIKQQLIKAKNSLTENVVLKKQLANVKQDMNHIKLILTQTEAQYSKYQKQAQYYHMQFNSAKKQLERLQNENNDLRLTSYQTIKQNGQNWLSVQSENNKLKTQLQFLKRQSSKHQLRNANSNQGNQNVLSPTNKTKLESEVLYLKRKNQDLTKQIINVNQRMKIMMQSYQQNLRSLSPTKITKVSTDFTLQQVKTKFQSYQNKSLELSRRLHAKQNTEDMLKDRISQLQNQKRQLKEKLQIIEKKEKSLQDSKRYSSEFSKYQLQHLNEKFEKTVKELNESLKRKNKDILQKDNFITSFLLSKIKPQNQAGKVIQLIKQYFSHTSHID